MHQLLTEKTNRQMNIEGFKQKFIDESENHLETLEGLLVDLETDFDNIELVREIFRILHTIKGNSGMFGFEKIVEVTHDLENIFDLVRSSKLSVTSKMIDVSLEIADHIRILLFEENVSDATLIKHYEIIGQIELMKKDLKIAGAPDNIEIVNRQLSEETGVTRTWHIVLSLDDDIERRAINLMYILQDLYQIGICRIANINLNDNKQSAGIFLITDKSRDTIEEVLMYIEDYYRLLLIAEYDIFKEDISKHSPLIDYSSMSISDAIENPEKYLQSIEKHDNDSQKKPQLHISNTINVNVSKLDNLMFLVSELVTVKSELQNALELKDFEKSIYAAEKIENLSKLFNQSALNLRLVSIHELTDKYKRQIRDLAKQVNKEIRFEVIGSDIELDKYIIDTLCEPVMHLLRNCIDHGIESPDKRLEKGKSSEGTVTIKATRQGNNVFVAISDDGNGINKKYVYDKAVERGIIQQGDTLTDQELYNIIFYPGFSTAKSLSNISGRGVGLDVVLKKIQEIRGEVIVDSIEGKGTTFTLKLQQTISIIDTLLVESNKIIYAIPIEDIAACTFVPETHKLDKERGLINLEGDLTPYLFIEPESVNNSNASSKLVVIKKDSLKYAIAVDKVIGEFQAVIKPLTGVFKQMKFLMGATFLGDGSLAILLDTEKLWDNN